MANYSTGAASYRDCPALLLIVNSSHLVWPGDPTARFIRQKLAGAGEQWHVIIAMGFHS
jgi:hypothetical protein